MKKLALALLGTLFLAGLISCGKSSEESTNKNTKDSIQEASLKTKQPKPALPAESMVKNKIFGFGVNLKDCDALTYSEYFAMMKFNNDNTLETMTASAMNAGAADFFELRTVSKGTYEIKGEVMTIKFTSLKEEKIKQGKTVESKEQTRAITWSLKMTKCEDGRLQLKSNMPGKNAMGSKAEPNDNSSWALKM